MAATTETIRDRYGRIVAHLRSENDTVKLLDQQFRHLGSYIRTRDQTVDAGYRLVGRGDQLLRLLAGR